MDGYIVTVVLTGGIPLLGLAVSYGTVRARLNHHSKELFRLNECKAEEKVMQMGFTSLNDKLDVIIKLTKQNNRLKE